MLVMDGGKNDPFKRLRGWESYGQQVDQLRQDADPEAFFFVTGHRYATCQLAFHLPDQPFVYQFQPAGQIHSQYAFWPIPAEQTGNNAIIVHPYPEIQGPLPTELTDQFSQISPIKEIDVAVGRKRTDRYAVYLGINWLGRPTE